MVFNSDKFECLRFWPGKTSKPDFSYKSPDGTLIEEKEDLRDLGVQKSSDLTFFHSYSEYCEQSQSVDRLGSQNLQKKVKIGDDDNMEILNSIQD